MKKKTYIYTSINQVELDEVEENSERILPVYAVIPRTMDDGMGGDGTGITGCDSTGMC